MEHEEINPRNARIEDLELLQAFDSPNYGLEAQRNIDPKKVGDGSIYNKIGRFITLELIEVVNTENKSKGPKRTYYQTTEQGRQLKKEARQRLIDAGIFPAIEE